MLRESQFTQHALGQRTMADFQSVLVTGAGGLVGHATCLELERRGIGYVGIDRVGGRIDGIDVEIADVADVHRLYAIAARHSIDAIIHCAAHSGPMVLADNPAAVLAANIGGTVNLIELARVRSMRRFVYCSSVSAIGPAALAGDGQTTLAPTTAYGASKAACEAIVNAYRAQHGLDGVCLRFASVYGPRRTTDCVLRDMVRAVVGRKRFEQPAGGDFEHQYVHVEDVARSLVGALLTSNLPRLAYMITGGTIISVAGLGRLVAETLGEGEIAVGSGPEPRFDNQAQFDIDAAERDFGYRPQVSLADGIRAYADFFRKVA